MKNVMKSCTLSIALLTSLAAGAWAAPWVAEAPIAGCRPPSQMVATTGGEQSADIEDEEGYIYHDGGIRFYLPDDWEAEREGKDILVLGPSDESVAVMVWVAGDMGLKEAAGHVDDMLAKFLTDIEVDEDYTEEGDENGVPVVWLAGTGISEGEECAWQVTFVQADKLIVFLTVGDEEGLDDQSAALEELDESIELAPAKQ